MLEERVPGNTVSDADVKIVGGNAEALPSLWIGCPDQNRSPREFGDFASCKDPRNSLGWLEEAATATQYP